MTPPEDYVRASLFLAGQEGKPPLTAEHAEALIGKEMDVSFGPVHIGSGIVVDVRLLDEGRRLQLSVECGGRSCTVCHRVFAEQDAPAELTRADTFTDEAAKPFATWALVYRDLPAWSPVCRNWATCSRVRMDNADLQFERAADADEDAHSAAAGANL